MLRVLGPNRKSDCCGVPSLCGIMVLHMCVITIHSEEWEKLGAWNLLLAFMHPENLQSEHVPLDHGQSGILRHFISSGRK